MGLKKAKIFASWLFTGKLSAPGNSDAEENEHKDKNCWFSSFRNSEYWPFVSALVPPMQVNACKPNASLMSIDQGAHHCQGI